MTILTEGNRSMAFVLSEANDWRSRDEETVTLPAGGLEAGTVLGRVTSSGKFVRHAAGASDGSEDEAGILCMTIDSEAGGDVQAAVLKRDAEVIEAELTYEVGADAAQVTASNAALAALGIIVRNQA